MKNGNPLKVKPCKHGKDCNDMTNCNFWHDPNLIPGSKDIRNFMQNSWMYAGQNRDLDGLAICHSGDRRFVELEGPLVNEEEADRRMYQAMHDLLNIFMFSDDVINNINRSKIF